MYFISHCDLLESSDDRVTVRVSWKCTTEKDEKCHF